MTRKVWILPPVGAHRDGRDQLLDRFLRPPQSGSEQSESSRARVDATPLMDGPGQEEEEDSFPIGGDFDIDIDDGKDEDDVNEEDATIDMPGLHHSAPSAPTLHPARSAVTIRWCGAHQGGAKTRKT